MCLKNTNFTKKNTVLFAVSEIQKKINDANLLYFI